MWTHRTPYVPSDLTEESIERHGRIALNRALHLDRVIAFVGSGVSAAYGGPAWTDFAMFMVAAVRDATQGRDFPTGLQAIRDNLAKIVGSESLNPKPDFAGEIGDKLTTLLALCEDALRLVDAYPGSDAEAAPSNSQSADDAEPSALPFIDNLRMNTATVKRSAQIQSDTRRQSARRRLASEIVANGTQDAARRLVDLLERRSQGERLEPMLQNLTKVVSQLGLEDEHTHNQKRRTVTKEGSVPKTDQTTGIAPLFVDHLLLYDALLGDALPLDTGAPELAHTGGAAKGADIIKNILDLGIGRFATLNYDVTLERRIHALKGDVGEGFNTDFRDLLWPTTAQARKEVKPDISSGGQGSRTVRSTILTDLTAGELFNFALRDSVDGSHVVHIHGRYDDPDNILLTEEDYRRQYIASGESAGALGETMRVMFSGNDVLFIGVGLNEDDVLGPLRSVLTRDRSPDADARQTIALMAATVPKLRRAEKDNTNAIADSARRDSLFAVHQKLKYGINVLRYGRDDRGYQRLTGFIQSLQDEYKTPSLPKSASFSRFKLRWKHKIYASLCLKFTVRTKSLKTFMTHGHERWKSVNQLEAVSWYGQKLAEILNSCGSHVPEANAPKTRLFEPEEEILKKLCDHIDQYRGDMRRHAAVEILKILRSRVQARALAAELARIKTDKDKWWEDWRCLPRDRRPRFHLQLPPKDTKQEDDYPVWVRHYPDLVTPLGGFDTEGQAAFDRAVKLGRIEADRPQPNPRSRSRVLRLSVPRGGGKGALLRILFEPRAHRRIFDRATYDGAFFAHMSFSMEFSSVVGALSRFVAGRIAHRTVDMPFWYPDPQGLTPDEVETRRRTLVASWEKWPERALGNPTAKQIDEWSTEPAKAQSRKPYDKPLRLTRLELLRGLLERYDRITRDAQREPLSDARLFICLGGLDRLCNEHGDAYNPLHRAFFRLLTGSGETLPGGGPGDPPLDIVLVASRRDVPIAYLSREGDPENMKPQDRYVYAQTSETKRHLMRWDELPRLPWKARLRLTPDWTTSRPADVSDPGNPKNILIEELDRTPDKYDPCMPARREFWESIALSSWGLSNVDEFVKSRIENDSKAEPQSLVKEWLHRMSLAAEKGGFAGVLSEILLCYREIDTARAGHGDERYGIGLCDKVLETLALFAVPVELAVLYGCPGIRSLLRPQKDVALRRARYDRLKGAIEKLVRRGLLIEVRPGGGAGELAYDPDKDPYEYERHVRYAVHDQLRELIANRMRLFVPDGRDRNHFQVSIYCEQPRDTPTPSMARFKEVRDILRVQIGRSRETLGALYVLDQFSGHSKNQERARSSEDQSTDNQRRLTERHIERITNALGAIEKICFKEAENEAETGLFDRHIRLHAVPQRLRACYALLRGSFSISALSRLSGEEIDPIGDRPFDEYRSWLRGLINAAIGLYEVESLTRDIVKPHADGDPAVLTILDDLSTSIADRPAEDSLKEKIEALRRKIGKLKDRKGDLQTSKVGSVKHPYYVDEIAWLLNERGLASFVQGRIYDALADFERALTWVARDPKGAEDPAYRALERRIRLNRAIAMIDAGQIARARSNLSEIRSDVAPFAGGSPSAMHLHARGYLALCDHLTGNFEQARSGYETAVRESNESGNLRAAALYNAHLGDLLSRLGKREEAEEKIYLARSAAAQSEQRDILHLVILRHAQQLLTVGNAKGAVERTAQAEAYGDALGLHKIRAEAMLVRAEGLLLQGDARGAGTAAAQGVAICHRHGLRLRRIAMSILYGETLFARGDKALAIPVLLEAKREAETIGYHLKGARAQRILSSFEFSTPSPPPADYAGSQTGIAW